ncbi:hypothetical protein B0H14DRAFT_3021814, partial [Mycena olivaceomarginata]
FCCLGKVIVLLADVSQSEHALCSAAMDIHMCKSFQCCCEQADSCIFIILNKGNISDKLQELGRLLASDLI